MTGLGFAAFGGQLCKFPVGDLCTCIGDGGLGTPRLVAKGDDGVAANFLADAGEVGMAGDCAVEDGCVAVGNGWACNALLSGDELVTVATLD